MKTKFTLGLFLMLCYSLVYSQVPIDSLVSYYPLDFNVKDAVGFNDATSFRTKSEINRFNNPIGCYGFDGYDSYVDLKSSFDFSERTINLWFFANKIDQIERSIYISDGPSIKNGFTQIKIQNKSGVKAIRMSAGVAGAESAEEVSESVWYMVTLVAKPDSTFHYLNGNLVGKFANGTISSKDGNTTVLLGTSRKFDRYFSGRIDDVRIYKRPLKPQEILKLYFEGVCTETVSVTDTLYIKTNLSSFNPPAFSNNIKVYPNPTSDYLNIDADDASLGFTLTVSNSKGAVVYTTVIEKNQNTMKISDWSGLGIYYLQFKDKNDVIVDVKKVVLN